jgi:hypothetical protein
MVELIASCWGRLNTWTLSEVKWAWCGGVSVVCSHIEQGHIQFTVDQINLPLAATHVGGLSSLLWSYRLVLNSLTFVRTIIHFQLRCIKIWFVTGRSHTRTLDYIIGVGQTGTTSPCVVLEYDGITRAYYGDQRKSVSARYAGQLNKLWHVNLPFHRDYVDSVCSRFKCRFLKPRDQTDQGVLRSLH